MLSTHTQWWRDTDVYKTDSPHVTQRHSFTNISKTFNFSFQKGDEMFK